MGSKLAARLITRRIGSGTYVIYAGPTSAHRQLGLIIPNLGQTEIFEPICGHMAEIAERYNASLLWSGAITDEGKQQALQLAERYVEQRVDGVFFAPLEYDPKAESVNQQIITTLSNGGVAIVLLDRHASALRDRQRFDLVGLDNFEAGFLVTDHLLEQNCRKVAFFARPGSASTVSRRIEGYQAALIKSGQLPQSEWVVCNEADDQTAVSRLMEQEPDGVVCANDETAAALMKILHERDLQVPKAVRVVGFDDVKFARMLTPSLTSYRQPCQAIAKVAMNTMENRLDHPGLPARSIWLQGDLITRESSSCTT